MAKNPVLTFWDVACEDEVMALYDRVTIEALLCEAGVFAVRRVRFRFGVVNKAGEAPAAGVFKRFWVTHHKLHSLQHVRLDGVRKRVDGLERVPYLDEDRAVRKLLAVLRNTLLIRLRSEEHTSELQSHSDLV